MSSLTREDRVCSACGTDCGTQLGQVCSVYLSQWVERAERAEAEVSRLRDDSEFRAVRDERTAAVLARLLDALDAAEAKLAAADHRVQRQARLIEKYGGHQGPCDQAEPCSCGWSTVKEQAFGEAHEAQLRAGRTPEELERHYENRAAIQTVLARREARGRIAGLREAADRCELAAGRARLIGQDGWCYAAGECAGQIRELIDTPQERQGGDDAG